LVLGNLELPIAALLLIEEASNTPEELQSNFGIVDECSSKSKLNEQRNFIAVCIIGLVIFQQKTKTSASPQLESTNAAGRRHLLSPMPFSPNSHLALGHLCVLLKFQKGETIIVFSDY
jgi:hypothetical protein